MTKSNRKGTFQLLIIMILVVLIVTGSSLTILYRVVLNEKKEYLRELSENQISTIKSFYKHTKDTKDILSFLKNQQKFNSVLGKTGEFIIAYINKDTIYFLLDHLGYDFHNPRSIPLKSKIGIPIQYALSRHAGFIRGLDYSGNKVLAFCDYIPELHWGIVTKINISETVEPFYKAGLYGLISAIFLVFIGTLIFIGYSNPIVNKIIENEKQLTLITDNIPVNIAHIDKNLKYLYVNQKLADRYAKSKEEIIGKKVIEIVPKQEFENAYPSIQKVLDGETVFFENSYFYPNGEQHFLNLFYVPHIDNKNRVVGYYLLIQDITEQKIAEQQLKRVASDLKNLVATKDKFFGIIAHDLRNPFTSLIGASELLYKDVDQYSHNSIKKISKLINEAAKQGYSLLENLLEWSKSQTGNLAYNPQNLHIKELIAENMAAMEMQANHKKISIFSDISDDIQAFADKDMLNTVLRNLLSNALKFTHKGGKVWITAQRNGNDVLLTVKDNGIGIPKNDLDKLFRIDIKYSNMGTSEEKGTGLGLLLCKEFVEKHSGKIWVESEEDSGSEFKFTIPST